MSEEKPGLLGSVTGAEINTAPPALTKGEYRVGISFNPSGFPEVDRVKRLSADLIDEIEKIAQASSNGEVKRVCAIAQTEIECGQ